MNIKTKNRRFSAKVIHKANVIINEYMSGQRKTKLIVSRMGRFKSLEVGRRYRLITSLLNDDWLLLTHESYNRYVQ